jgi:hypothetical protein
MIRRNSLEKINRINPDLGLFRVMTHHNACLTSKRHAMLTLIAALALIWATGRQYSMLYAVEGCGKVDDAEKNARSISWSDLSCDGEGGRAGGDLPG